MELLKQRVIIPLNSSKTIYYDKNCYFSKLIFIAKNFAKVPNLQFSDIHSLSQNDANKIIEKSPTSTLPVLQDDDYYLSGTNSIVKYILKHYQFEEKLFGGGDNKLNGLINMWVDFCTYNIWPLYTHTVGQILGT